MKRKGGGDTYNSVKREARSAMAERQGRPAKARAQAKLQSTRRRPNVRACKVSGEENKNGGEKGFGKCFGCLSAEEIRGNVRECLNERGVT